jgi:hypothetical protein
MDLGYTQKLEKCFCPPLCAPQKLREVLWPPDNFQCSKKLIEVLPSPLTPALLSSAKNIEKCSLSISFFGKRGFFSALLYATKIKRSAALFRYHCLFCIAAERGASFEGLLLRGFF